MRVTFLGTNGWYDSATGNTSCILVDSPDLAIVLDAGNGLYKLERYCRRDKTTFLLLSHFHLDHICGLHILGKFSFSKGLTIAGPRGTRGILQALISQPFTMPLADLPFRVNLLELPRQRRTFPFPLECATLLHSTLTLGYRIDLGGKVIVYCPDTGYCKAAVNLARKADLLITECSFRSGMVDPGWPHLNPEIASRIAQEASVHQLVLTHFDANSYKTAASRRAAETQARKGFPDTVAARDGMVIDL